MTAAARKKGRVQPQLSAVNAYAPAQAESLRPAEAVPERPKERH